MRYHSVALISCLLVLCLLTTSCQKQPVTLLEHATEHFRGGQWDEAVAACDRHLSGDPNNREALSIRGRAHLAAKNYDAAIADFTSLIELDESECDPFYRRSMAYEALGQSNLAKLDKDRARSLDPLRKTAYAYEAGNFIDKPQFSDGPVHSDDDSESDELSESDDGANEMLAEDNESALDRELNQDFYDRQSQSEEVAASEATDESESPQMLPDTYSSAVRSSIRKGNIDEDFVKGAVRGYRSAMESERSKASVPKLPSIASSSSLKLDDLLGPSRNALPDDESDSSKDAEALGPPLPPISTALPPGFGPMNSGIGTNQLGGVRGAYPGAPYRAGQLSGGISPPVSGAPSARQGLVPGLPGNLAGGSPYQLQGSPVYQGKKPTLSTSLPAGRAGVPGATNRSIGGGRIGQSAPLSTSRNLPAMLPRTDSTLRTDYP